MNSKQLAPPWRYRLLLMMLSPLIVLHTLWRSHRDGGARFRQQRLGFGLPKIAQKCVWVHAASVGEVITATPLIQSLHQHYPQHQLLLTTTTPTGFSTLKRLHSNHATLAYLPIDFDSAVRRFYRDTKIQCGIIVETEIWPNLYHRSPAPLAIVNGRLSSRSLNAAAGWARKIYQHALQVPDLIATRSDSDRAAFVQIGANPDTTLNVGNLKFSGVVPDLAAVSALCERSYCLLASTHDDEEEQLTQAWLKNQRDEVLVIAPRHPERSAAIQRQLHPLIKHLAVRSRGDVIDSNTRVYLADTFGELLQWYSHADAIFIGGSLIQRGGHNMLEAARVGKAVVCGPNTFNFVDEVAALQDAEAFLSGATASACIAHLIVLLDNPALAKQMGLSARQVVEKHEDVIDQYLGHLQPLLMHLPDTQP